VTLLVKKVIDMSDMAIVVMSMEDDIDDIDVLEAMLAIPVEVAPIAMVVEDPMFIPLMLISIVPVK